MQSTATLITDVPKWNQSSKPEPLHVCTETMPGMPLGSTAILITDVPQWNQSGTEPEPNEIARRLKRIACFWRWTVPEPSWNQGGTKHPKSVGCVQIMCVPRTLSFYCWRCSNTWNQGGTNPEPSAIAGSLERIVHFCRKLLPALPSIIIPKKS